MKLLIVDGSNMVMRAAFGGTLEPHIAIPTATGLIRKAAEFVAATHILVALDCPGKPLWRHAVSADYKANRTRDNSPWIDGAFTAWQNEFRVERIEGFEADDLIATVAARARAAGIEAVACSNDSDLLPLVSNGTAVCKPTNGGSFVMVDSIWVRNKYAIAEPWQLRDLKALTGETGDNIAGVPGIGPKRAAALLADHRDMVGVVLAGQNKVCKQSMLVHAHRETVATAYELLGLKEDAPVPKLVPGELKFRLP